MEKRITKKVISLLTILVMMLGIMPTKTTLASDAVSVYVRVEGINSTITEGESSGTTVYEALTNLLDKKSIDYVLTQGAYGPYISSIAGLTEASFGGYDGWMYVIKNGSVISDYMDLQDGCEVTFYYGAYGTTYSPNSIKFDPEVPKANEEFTLTVANSSLDWTTNQEVVTPLKDIIVSIDGKQYTTDDNGQIKLSLDNGTHTYEFADNNDANTIPTVIKSKGTFITDGVNKPQILYSDKNYDNTNKDNISTDLDEYIKNTTSYMTSKKVSQWGAYSLYKQSTKATEGFLDSLKENISYGVNDMSGTELESAIIGLASLGYSPYNFEGVDLVSELYNRDIDKFVNNEAIFALLVYRAVNLKDDYKITEADMVNKILAGYDNNGWSWNGIGSDPDMTGAAINALAPYYNGKTLDGVDNTEIKNKVDSSIELLKNAQLEDGNIGGTYGASSETNAFVILGLVSIGIDPNGAEFTKDNGSLLTALLSYSGDNGAFNHNDSLKNNMYATENVYRALIALKDFYSNGVADYYTSNLKLTKDEDNSSDIDDSNKDNSNNNTGVNNSTTSSNDKSQGSSTSGDRNKTAVASKNKTGDNNNMYILLLVCTTAVVVMANAIGNKREGINNEAK